jgi:hypothetical protein
MARPIESMLEAACCAARTWERPPAGRQLAVMIAMLAIVGALAVAGVSPPAALAICAEPPCKPVGPNDDPPPPPPPSTKTAVAGISPSFAWSGDTITLTGTGFTGAAVSVNNPPAQIASATSTRLIVTVPSITNPVAGPMSVPVVVSSPTGTASTSFTLSPTLQLTRHATFGVNAQFGQGADGWATATATLDRSSGFEHSKLVVHNDDFMLSLVVNMSTAWLDASGTVIGFTDPDTVTSTGSFYHWPSGDTTTTDDFSHVVGPDPGVAPFARSAQIVMVRDAEAELLSTLSGAVETGQTIGDVVSTLAPFFV